MHFTETSLCPYIYVPVYVHFHHTRQSSMIDHKLDGNMSEYLVFQSNSVVLITDILRQNIFFPSSAPILLLYFHSKKTLVRGELDRI